jgi:hypothetical protein
VSGFALIYLAPYHYVLLINPLTDLLLSASSFGSFMLWTITFIGTIQMLLTICFNKKRKKKEITVGVFDFLSLNFHMLISFSSSTFSLPPPCKSKQKRASSINKRLQKPLNLHCQQQRSVLRKARKRLQ